MTKSDYFIRAATKDDIDALCGGDDILLECIAIEYGGRLACVTGIIEENGYYRLFQNINKTMNYPKTFVFRLSCFVVEYFSRKYRPIICFANTHVETNGEVHIPSARYLEKLGFCQIDIIDEIGVFQLWQN